MFIDDIALTMQAGVGVKTAVHLLECFGTAERVFAASKGQLMEIAGLNEGLAREIPLKKYHKLAESELKYCGKHGITPIESTSEYYPKLLKECGDYPHMIYYQGDAKALNRRMLSIVGTRKITSYGYKVCDRIVADLAILFPDITIVSGLAYGVDAAAHRAALSSGVATIGVLANQLPEIAPAPHRALAEEMMKNGGGVLTEYNSQNRNKGVNFIPRNRIIAGLSSATLVVESGYDGGALSTMNMADGYNRIAMAVPGRIGETASVGTNFAIKTQRAVMITSAADIARELGWERVGELGQKREERLISSDAARHLLSFIDEGEQVSIDLLSEQSGLPISQLTLLLLELEMDGFLRLAPGKMYEKS